MSLRRMFGHLLIGFEANVRVAEEYIDKQTSLQGGHINEGNFPTSEPNQVPSSQNTPPHACYFKQLVIETKELKFLALAWVAQ